MTIDKQTTYAEQRRINRENNPKIETRSETVTEKVIVRQHTPEKQAEINATSLVETEALLKEANAARDENFAKMGII